MTSSTSSSEWRGIVLKTGAHLLACAVALTLFYYGAQAVVPLRFGPSTAAQITKSFQQVQNQPRYDCILLGNSRVYRGLNPAKLGGRVFNFAHDGDGFNNVFYKLEYLKRLDKLPSRIVVGIDYFMFSSMDDSRAELYRAYFPPQFIDDYHFPPKTGWGETANERLNQWMQLHISQMLPLVVETILHPAPVRSLSPNGQYRVLSERSGAYRRSPYEPLRRAGGITSWTQMQRTYFEKSLELCRQNGVEVILVMPPTSLYERHAYRPQDKAEFWSYINGQAGGCKLLNFEWDHEFTLRDFNDETHLKLDGGDRFSKLMREQLGWP